MYLACRYSNQSLPHGRTELDDGSEVGTTKKIGEATCMLSV